MNRFTLLGFAAIALWSVTVGLARGLSERVGFMAGGAAAYLVAGSLCLARQFALRSAGGLRGLPPRYLLGCGSLFVSYLLVFYLAIGMAADRGQVLGVGLANYLWPALTILFSLALLGKRAGLLLIPGTLAALAGVVLVMTEGSGVAASEVLAGSSFAYLPALAGAVLWALYSNLTARWMADRSESAVSLFMLATGAVLLALSLLHPAAGPWSGRSLAEASCLGLATAAGYECWELAMRKGDVSVVAAASYFTPLFSTLFSCLYLGITPGWRLWLGCALVVAGSLASWRSLR